MWLFVPQHLEWYLSSEILQNANEQKTEESTSNQGFSNTLLQQKWMKVTTKIPKPIKNTKAYITMTCVTTIS